MARKLKPEHDPNFKKSDYLTGKKKLRGAKLEIIPTSKLRPPHSVCLASCADIIKSLKEDGWIRRPLLGFRVGDKVQCVTGSHRVRSAKRVRRKTVPVFIIGPKMIQRFVEQGLDMKDVCPFFYWNKRTIFKPYIRYDWNNKEM